jgi:hypothetical protein
MVPLRELALNGTERGKRKAVQLLERMSRFLVMQHEDIASQQLDEIERQLVALGPNVTEADLDQLGLL